LHSEWSEEDSPIYDDNDSLTNALRQLKSGGGGRGGSSGGRSSGSSFGGGRTGMIGCMGGGCSSGIYDAGSGAQIGIIIGCLVGGCGLIIGFYFLYHYCKEKSKMDRIKSRKVGDSSDLDFSAHGSDSDGVSRYPKQPIVILPD